MNSKSTPLMLSFLLAAACDRSGQSPPPPGRVVAVKATEEKRVSLQEFCDVTATTTDQRVFRLPEVEGSTPPPATGASWVNIWATWCKPCVEEMPMLVKWRERLGREGINFSLQFVSVDQSTDDVEAFRKQHPSIPPSLHLKNPADLPGWLQELGLDSGAGLPVHILVGGQGHLRCVRAASVGEHDYDTVARLLR